jgi:hypothetical protein
MKWIWMFGIIIVYISYYIFSWLAFSSNMNIIAIAAIISYGAVIFAITKLFINEYFL